MPSRPESFGPPAFSRRNFLRLTAAGLLGLVWPARPKKERAPALFSLDEQLGRVIPARLPIHQLPSYSSSEVHTVKQDVLLPITHVTIGDGEPAHNRVWYRVGPEGYAHSGGIQPVKSILNEPDAGIPARGLLAEITVPFSDGHYHPGQEYGVLYRVYYETTHWVDKLVHDRRGDPWYRVREDRWDLIYYIQAAHARLLRAGDLQPRSPKVPESAKRILVSLEHQTVTAYEHERPVFMTRASTGAKFSNGSFLTPQGRFLTFHKRPSRHMAAGNLAANGFDLPGVPWVCYLNEKGVALHGTYWHNDYGRPRSHGCINLSSQAARWFYLWTLPAVPAEDQRIYEDFGTIVDIY
jgi:lipoprotein-anchoring transpeptidase ErfK/SrfK